MTVDLRGRIRRESHPWLLRRLPPDRVEQFVMRASEKPTHKQSCFSISSPPYCGSSPSCGHRLIQQWRERPGCHAFQRKPRERCVLITAKSKCLGSNGQTLRLWRTGDAICQGSVLPKLPIPANLDLNQPVIRWMSVQSLSGCALFGANNSDYISQHAGDSLIC